MDLEKIFKNLIWLSLLTAIFMFSTSASEPQEYFDISARLGGATFSDHTLMTLGLVYMAGYLISLYMLYNFVKFGKTLFVAMIVLGAFGTLGMGTIVASPLTEVVGYFGGMIDGAVLVMLYVTDIKDKFA